MPSRIKSAGYNFSNRSFLLGKSKQFHDAEPASIHTSKISGILSFLWPHLHFIVTSSIHGLCKSSGIFPASFFNSPIEPTTVKSLHFLHFHIGKGVPQYLCLVIPLSLKFASQLSKFLEPAKSGTHFMFLFSFLIRSFRSSILKNHWIVVL